MLKSNNVLSYTLIFAVLIALFASCESKADTGAGRGSGMNIASGTLISAAPGDPLISGASLDNSDRHLLEEQSPRTLKKIDRGEQLSIDDIKKMSKASLSDRVIIGQIQATHSAFYLSTADIVDLKSAGVSQRVIDYMIRTGNQ